MKLRVLDSLNSPTSPLLTSAFKVSTLIDSMKLQLHNLNLRKDNNNTSHMITKWHWLHWKQFSSLLMKMLLFMKNFSHFQIIHTKIIILQEINHHVQDKIKKLRLNKKKGPTCYNCGIYGHTFHNCHSPNQQNKPLGNNYTGKTNYQRPQ